MKAREETVTTPPPEESEHVVTTPPSQHGEDFPADYPPKDQPDAPLGAEDSLVIPLLIEHNVSLQMTHSLDSGQIRQLIPQMKTKGDTGG